MNTIFFKVIAYETSDYEASVALRQEVLRTPLGLVFSPEELEKEAHHIHLVGFSDNKLIATASLVPEQSACKMRQVAVHPCMQGQGIGSKLVDFCESHAIEKGYQSIHCHARDYAVPFYTKKGYVSEGGYFMEVNIPHLHMRKVLSAL
ncbi:MAG: GNAT family N-acetyltransferase [Alphaproteobacteria bacterium]